MPAAAAAAPVVDVNAANAQTYTDDHLHSAVFSTQHPGELLVAMFSADGPNYGGLTQSVTSVSGCGLTWTQAGQANGVAGVAAVYTAYAATTVTACEVTGDLAYAWDGLVHIVSFTGAQPQVANPHAISDVWSGAGFGAVGIPADNSLVYQVGHNWSSAEIPVPIGGDTSGPPQQVAASLVSTYLSAVGDTSYVARIDDPLAATPAGTDRYANLAVWFDGPGLVNSVSFAVVPAG